MSHFEKIIIPILEREGGFVDHPQDPGGATNKGITFVTFKNHAQSILGIEPTLENLKNLSDDQAKTLYYYLYWLKINGEYIENINIAELLLDMAINSGCKTAVKYLQESINFISGTDPIKEDGACGPITTELINKSDAKILFRAFKINRISFFNNLVKRKPSLKVFLNGWMNRINGFKYKD
jgi:lysozyme family protein